MTSCNYGPAGVTGNVQFNADGVFGAYPGFFVDFENNPNLRFMASEEATGDTNFALGSQESSVITFINSLSSDVYGALRSDVEGTYLSSTEGLLIETDLLGVAPGWNFNKDGSLQLPQLEADPQEAPEGSIWYRSDTHEWRGCNGTDYGTFTFTAD